MPPEHMLAGLANSLIFGVLGIALLLVGFRLFDWTLPKVDFQESMKSNPLAAAIVIAAFFLAVAHIVASVVS